MTTQRYVYAAILFFLTLLASATSAGLLSAHYAAWAGVIGAALTGALTVIRQAPAPDAVSKAADLASKGGVGFMCLALVLVACSASQQKAETQAAPDCLKCALEVVPVFTVTRDAGPKASDAAGDAK
jgi:hypothetical protein